MQNLLIGKNSAIKGFGIFFLLILCLITFCGAISSKDVFIQIVAIITIIVWIGIISLIYKNIDAIWNFFFPQKKV